MKHETARETARIQADVQVRQMEVFGHMMQDMVRAQGNSGGRSLGRRSPRQFRSRSRGSSGDKDASARAFQNFLLFRYII